MFLCRLVNYKWNAEQQIKLWNFHVSPLAKHSRTNIRQIQIVDGRHRFPFGHHIQMISLLRQQTFRLVCAIAIAIGHWYIHSNWLIFGSTLLMQFAKNRLLPNGFVAIQCRFDLIFTLQSRSPAHMGATTNSILIVNGVRIVQIDLHGQIQRRIDEKGEYCETAENQNRNVQSEIFVGQIGEAECVDEYVIGYECPQHVQNEQCFEEQKPGESVNGTIWCWCRCMFGHDADKSIRSRNLGPAVRIRSMFECTESVRRRMNWHQHEYAWPVAPWNVWKKKFTFSEEFGYGRFRLLTPESVSRSMSFAWWRHFVWAQHQFSEHCRRFRHAVTLEMEFSNRYKNRNATIEWLNAIDCWHIHLHFVSGCLIRLGHHTITMFGILPILRPKQEVCDRTKCKVLI